MAIDDSTLDPHNSTSDGGRSLTADNSQTSYRKYLRGRLWRHSGYPREIPGCRPDGSLRKPARIGKLLECPMTSIPLRKSQSSKLPGLYFADWDFLRGMEV